MGRNASGVYSLPAGSTITNGDTSDASDLNTPLNDLATDMNTARPIVAGGTGATSASAARTALGLEIGTDVQAHDDGLAAIAAAGITAVSGADLTILTGTAGTDTYVPQWNADGDLVDGYAVLDEDDMASDSETAIPTQQSVKAFVGGGAAEFVHLRDVKTSGTAGDTYTADSWQDVTINNEVHDGLGVSVASNQFSLAAGTYEVEAYLPIVAHNVTTSQNCVYAVRLYDTTNAVSLADGQGFTGQRNGDTAQLASVTVLRGVFTLSGTAALELQIYPVSFGIGIGEPAGILLRPERYTDLIIRKIA